MLRAPRLRSLQPIAKIIAFALTVNTPFSLFMAVISLSFEIDRTVVSKSVSMFLFYTSTENLAAYSGPARLSLNLAKPKPL